MSGSKRSKHSSRREFLHQAACVGSGAVLCSPALAAIFGHRRFAGHAVQAQEWEPKGKTPRGKYHLVVAKGNDPAKMVEKALDTLGALDRFFAKGDKVLIKPNVGWDRTPEQAANANPEVVGALVEIALEAGAKSVTVADHTCNDPRKCFNRSGIKEAAEDAGAEVVMMRRRDYTEVRMKGKVVDDWPAYSDYPSFDKVINVPIAKHHGLSRVTLAMKNYFGLVGGNRGKLHQDINDTIPDLARFFTTVRPTLTVLDAWRVLTRNGPQGGRLRDVREEKTLVVGYAPASVDAFGATLFNLRPERVGHIREGGNRGLGPIDLKHLKIKRITT